MITNVANTQSYKPNFTSEIRMSYSTASTLNQYQKRVQKFIYRQLENLERNGEDNLVSITYRYDIDPNQAVGRDLLGVQVLKRDGNNVILASPIIESDICMPKVSKKGSVRHKVVNVNSLYEIAKKDMLPLCDDNIFSRFI